MKEEVISVVIVDDHPFFRKGISLYLKGNEEINLVKEFTNGQEILTFLEKNSDDIDVIIMDLQMPQIDGEEATRKIGKQWPDIRILVLTSYGSWDKVYALLNSGARGYLLKDSPPEELVIAIKAVYTGGTYFGSDVAEQLLNRVSRKEETISQCDRDEELIEPLTNRERDVLQLIGKGLCNSEIGDNLHISENTVKTHVSNIFQKLNVSSRTQAAFYAMQRGLF